MGYESILIAAEIGPPFAASGNRSMLQPVATFDLSKMGSGEFTDLVSARHQPHDDRYYWYPHLASGYTATDTQLTTDPYDEPPTTLNFDTTILALEADDDGYRRLAPVIAALKVYAAQLNAGMWHPDRFGLFHIGH